MTNSSLSSGDNEATKCMILQLLGVPKFISSVISTSNVDLSFNEGMSNLPSLSTSEGFSPLDTSFIFTFSWSNGAFQFSPRDLLVSFFVIFSILRLEDGVDSLKYAMTFRSMENLDL